MARCKKKPALTSGERKTGARSSFQTVKQTLVQERTEKTKAQEEVEKLKKLLEEEKKEKDELKNERDAFKKDLDLEREKRHELVEARVLSRIGFLRSPWAAGQHVCAYMCGLPRLLWQLNVSEAFLFIVTADLIRGNRGPSAVTAEDPR